MAEWVLDLNQGACFRGKVIAPAQPSKGRFAALAAVNAAAVIFGSNALYGRIEASPVWLVAGRIFFAAVVLLLISALRGRLVRVSLRELLAVAAGGALIALHWIAFFASVQLGGVAIATLTVSAFPLFSILIEAVRRHKAPDLVEVASCAAIMAAIALIARPHGGGHALAGAVAGLISAALFSFYSLASERLLRRIGPVNLSLYQYGIACLLLLPFLPFHAAPANGASWLALIALGVVGTAVSFQLYLFALGHLPAAVCGGFTCLEPVYAIALAAALFREPVTPLVAVSAAIIVAASLVLLKWSKAPAPEPGVL